ncbi:MAG TPA: CAP domain-containing protein [Candidatus Sericytochromatia bacterium]|jgi:uncharacterized protein YkwD
MKKNNRNSLLVAAAITLTSLPFGSGLTRATLSSTVIPNQNHNLKPSTSTTLTPSPQQIAQLKRSYSTRLLALINSERQKVGVAPLSLNSNLTQAALSQSKDMAMNNFFSHSGSNGSQVGDRVSATGYSWSAVAENIAAGQSTPFQVFQSWLNSPPHKQTMLNPQYTEVGFGSAYKAQSTYKAYWTADFAQPR